MRWTKLGTILIAGFLVAGLIYGFGSVQSHKKHPHLRRDRNIDFSQLQPGDRDRIVRNEQLYSRRCEEEELHRR